MNNARFRKTYQVISLLRSSGCGLRFLSPHSPQLNPNEEFFSVIKSRYLTVNPKAQTRNELKSFLQIILEGMNFKLA